MKKTNYIKDKKTSKMKGSYPSAVSPSSAPKPPHFDSREEETPNLPEYGDLYMSFSVMSEHRDTHKLPSLWEILDQAEYEDSLNKGHIRLQEHPLHPYIIHNYTEACTWEQGWNNSTLTCRGLITHAETGEVLARPFPKFFNHNQAEAPVFDLDEEVIVMDKVDGSLAISYRNPDGSIALATRGSFSSDQAAWANDFYNRTYKDSFTPEPHLTYLFEIIYPENRIVLDYGDTEELVLLGAVDIRTGRSVHIEDLKAQWKGPTVEVFPHTTLRQVLEAPDRDNAEGFVLWHPERDQRVKYKQEDYKRLHRYLTGTTPKHVWEVLSSGLDPNIEFAGAPDEFHGWLKQVVSELETQHSAIKKNALAEYENIVNTLGQDWQRKDFAAVAARSPNKSLLFFLLDDRDIDEYIWKGLKPSGSRTVRQVNSDAD